MAGRLRRSTPESSSSVELPIGEWPYLDEEVLVAHGEHLTRRCQGWTDDMCQATSALHPPGRLAQR